MNRPYFETKVVKVKKECEHLQIYYKPGMIGYRCRNCGAIVDTEGHIINKSPKGNWVNGENLDKIKFPVPCSYKPNKHETRKGLLNAGNYGGKDCYVLIDIIKQYPHRNIVSSHTDLKSLIKTWDIHILKGKLIIYEDDMEDKYSDD